MELFDLSVFFESDPIVGLGDGSWEYVGAAFHFQSESDDVWCRLAPGEGELSVIWRQREIKRAEISLEGYFNVKLERHTGIERLVAIPNDASKAPFVLQVRPHVFMALGAVTRQME